MSQQWDWGSVERNEASFSGAAGDDAWDDWDEFELGVFQDEFWDAFELDDSLEDPQPEYGDFWPETDDEEQT